MNDQSVVAARGYDTARTARRLAQLAAQYATLAPLLADLAGRIERFVGPGRATRAKPLMQGTVDSHPAGVHGVGSIMAPPPNCTYDPLTLAPTVGQVDTLSALMDDCFAVADGLPVGSQVLDRLTILGLLAREPSAGPAPTTLVARSRRYGAPSSAMEPRPARTSSSSPSARSNRTACGRLWFAARELGLEPDTVTAWLAHMLEQWRVVTPDGLDPAIRTSPYRWRAGHISSRVSLASLHTLVRAHYQRLGADVDWLGIAET